MKRSVGTQSKIINKIQEGHQDESRDTLAEGFLSLVFGEDPWERSLRACGVESARKLKKIQACDSMIPPHMPHFPLFQKRLVLQIFRYPLG